MKTSQRVKSLGTCDPNWSPLVASRSHPFISRRAIDPTGVFGCFYDAATDRVCRGSGSGLVSRVKEGSNTHGLSLKKILNQINSILEMLKIHTNLRVSTILELNQARGIGAAIDYADPIDQYTRLLSYNISSRTEYLPDNDYTHSSQRKKTIDNIQGTHVIVMVNYGIDAVAILQLPRDDAQASLINAALEKLCDNFNERSDAATSDKMTALQGIVCTTVFSNIPSLGEKNSFSEFYEHLKLVRDSPDLHRPYNYSLCPIEELFTVRSENQSKFFLLNDQFEMEIERTACNLRLKINWIERSINRICPEVQQQLHDTYNSIQKKVTDFRKRYNEYAGQLRQRIINYRRTGQKANDMDGVFQCMQSLTNDYTQLETETDQFVTKDSFVQKLLNEKFRYINANNYDVKMNDDSETIRKKLSLDHQSYRIIFCTDQLKSGPQSRWKSYDEQLKSEKQNDTQLGIIYVDCSYCPEQPNEIKLLKIEPRSTFDEVREASKSAKQSVNILLVGESGVGKSTFINALVNYLQFKSLDDALSQPEPLVILPVSFIITSGEEFHEHPVKYDGLDSSNAENFDKPGQSVTQYCRVYQIQLRQGSNAGKTLRLIDTPGFGDVRGLDQDDRNIREIFSFISNLESLDAICILLKPNVDRFSINFRSTIIGLVDLLSETACKHILFCFTNTRCTFYAPGSTGSLLVELLKSTVLKNIPFQKSNVFCFDNEAFRYLVAKKKGVPLDPEQKDWCGRSWQTSSEESQRFINHIFKIDGVYRVNEDCLSLRRLQWEIHLLLQPLTEAIRNDLRNQILDSQAGLRREIVLIPHPLQTRQWNINSKSLQLWQCGPFWINEYHLASDVKADDDYEAFYYRLEHEYRNKKQDFHLMSQKHKGSGLLDDLSICGAILGTVSGKHGEDRVLTRLMTMVEEEERIVKKKEPPCLNRELLGELKNLIKEYEQRVREMRSKDILSNLSSTRDHVKRIGQMEMIKEYLDAIKQTQLTIFQNSQFSVA